MSSHDTIFLKNERRVSKNSQYASDKRRSDGADFFRRFSVCAYRHLRTLCAVLTHDDSFSFELGLISNPSRK